jgi:hypothetical protein
MSTSRQVRTGGRTSVVARRALAALAMASAGWLGGVAMAQPGATAPRAPTTAPRPAQPQAQPAAGGVDRRAEIKRKIRAFRAYRLTEELALDETLAARVFPLLGKYDQQVEQLTIESVELLKALRPTTIDAKLADELIRRTLANRRAFVELDEKRIGELRKVLSAEQTARLLVVLPQIERQIKQQIRRSMRRDGDPLSEPGGRKRNRKARQQLELDDVE